MLGPWISMYDYCTAPSWKTSVVSYDTLYTLPVVLSQRCRRHATKIKSPVPMYIHNPSSNTGATLNI